MIDRAPIQSDAGSGTTVVITCYNQAKYLGEAIESARRQTLAPVEIVVVDDGSTDDTAVVARSFDGVRLVQQPNRGLAAARNTGLRACSSALVIFLDADDRLLAAAVDAGSNALCRRPEAAFAYGRFRYVSDQGSRRPAPLRGDAIAYPYLGLLRGNFIGMHGTVSYRASTLSAIGGFDERLEAGEDYDVYLRLARQYPLAPHDELVAEYRLHNQNISRDNLRMLKTALAVLQRQRPYLHDAARRRAFQQGWRAWIEFYGVAALREIKRLGTSGSPGEALSKLAAFGRTARLNAVPVTLRLGAARLLRILTAVGGVRRSLGRRTPVSSSFGYDRGRPVDRYYIETFLKEFAGDVRGRVLEVADDTYTQRFSGGMVTQADVLHVDDSNPPATIVADLASADHIPSDTFDCIIFTQTLHLIYDMEAAVGTLHRILKPGGVVLATVPGIGPISEDRWAETWYWSLTEPAARRLFESAFGREVVTYVAGNVLAASAFLYGLATEDLTERELEYFDARFPVTIGVRARK